MKKLEDLIAEKLYDLINYALSKIIKPDITIDKVTELDQKAIARLKQEHDIEGVILDVDDTLRRDMNKIPKCNQEWIETLKGQLKVIIVSNGKDESMENFFREKGINYIGFAHKPLKKNFIKACEMMRLEPEKVLVIGDRLLDDIHGGNRNNMRTALVKGVDDEEER